MTFFLLQHSFIQEAKSVSILNNMIQEALNIMEEESAREENEVRYNLIPRVISPLFHVPPTPFCPCS